MQLLVVDGTAKVDGELEALRDVRTQGLVEDSMRSRPSALARRIAASASCSSVPAALW